MAKVVKGLIAPAAILIAWFILSASGIWSAYILPTPQKVWHTFSAMIASGELILHVAISFKRVLIGYIIAFVAAFILGMPAGLKQNWADYYNPILEFMRHVPPISLIPLLILWSGIGERSKIIVIVLASFFPMFLNIEKGFSSCDNKLLEVGDCFGFTAFKKFRRIILPNAIPDVLVGLRIGLGFSWRAIIGAEMIAAAGGLGYLILDAQQMSRSDKIIVGIFAIGLVGVLCDGVFRIIIRMVLGVRGGAGDNRH